MAVAVPAIVDTATSRGRNGSGERHSYLRLGTASTAKTYDTEDLFRRLRIKSRTDSAARVAFRFLQLFRDHGVSFAEIQHFLPQITLGILRNPEALLDALTNNTLNQAADLFQIQRAWLDGREDSIYLGPWCYKHPEHFFDELARFHDGQTHAPVRALYCKSGNRWIGEEIERVALVFVQDLRSIDEATVYRYRPFTEPWDWRYQKCRIQLKAMARIVYKVLGLGGVPMYQVGHQILEEVVAGNRVPKEFLEHNDSNAPFLEDFGLSPQESAVAKESEEFPLVMNYIEDYNLIALAARVKKQDEPKA